VSIAGFAFCNGLLLCVKGKKVWTCDIAPLHEGTSLQKCSDMAHFVEGSHSFTCHPHTYLQMQRIIPAFVFPSGAGPYLSILGGMEAELAYRVVLRVTTLFWVTCY